MSDLIERQKAIDAVLDLSEKLADEMLFIDAIVDEIENLPSAEPERKWIPVTEALPEDRQKVLCVNKHGEMMVGGYMTDYGMTFPCYFEKPVAWMPLPESYRGEE